MSENSDFGTFGRYTEIPLQKMSPDQKKAYDFTVKERGGVGLGVDGPFKIWLQNPKLEEIMLPLSDYYHGGGLIAV